MYLGLQKLHPVLHFSCLLCTASSASKKLVLFCTSPVCCIISITTTFFFEQHSETQTPAISITITINILAVIHAE
jgi:hypothetical protein